MMFALPSRAIRGLAATAVALSVAGVPHGPLSSGSTFAQSAPPSSHASQVSATYQIALNGFNVGNFRYTSETGKQSYNLTSDVELSLLMGAFQWKGVSRTSGQTGDAALKPASFGFDYSSTLKSGSVRMGFAKGSVETVAIDPPAPPIPDVVPVKPEHLVNVLDPLSAILALTQDKGGKPCDRKLAIFDGKQRFDLQLIYRRQEPIEGSADTATVCRVKYIPIAGYRQTEETANLARTTGIEISFRQAAGAKLFVPQKIVLPTLAGAAEITLQRVDINTAGSGQIALVND
jgi:hypothetical protein